MNLSTVLQQKIIYYTGPSMNPTLKNGDRLVVIPYHNNKIRQGDVIVFHSPEDNHKITHRVVSIDSEGLKTRGDNNNKIDTTIISPDRILGRVISAHRNNRRLRVFGGPIGRSFAVALRINNLIKSGIFFLLRPVYERLARWGLFRGWPPVSAKIRIVSFNRPGGRELQLLIGQQVIGRLLPGKDRWHIKRPFRLFVDETSLPQSDHDYSASSEEYEKR